MIIQKNKDKTGNNRNEDFGIDAKFRKFEKPIEELIAVIK